MTLGYAMPRPRQCIITWYLVNCIKRWFTDNTRESFQEKFPWLMMSEATWTSTILANMNAWINLDEHYAPDLHTVKEILALYKPAGKDSACNAMNGLFSMAWELEMTCNARDGGKNEDRKRDKASSNVRACPHDGIATSYE